MPIGSLRACPDLPRGEGAPVRASHDADIHFTFVMAGRMRLEADRKPPHDLTAGDAFAPPPGLPALYAAPSDDIALVEVALPGRLATAITD